MRESEQDGVKESSERGNGVPLKCLSGVEGPFYLHCTAYQAQECFQTPKERKKSKGDNIKRRREI